MKIPSSPDKRYLGGADWCIAALSEGTVETTGRRCIFLIAIFLEGVPDLDRLEGAFADYCARFPVLGGRAGRCWCLAPYWRYEAGAAPAYRVGRHALPEGASREDAVRQIEALVNTRAAQGGWRVALDSVRFGGSASLLGFSFDHALFDASGAETFISLFIRHAQGEAKPEEYPPARQAAPAQLDGWVDKFRSGRKVNRLMRRLASGGTSWLALPPDAERRPFRFRALALSAEEARRVQRRAFETAGYLMFTPYALATAAQVFRPLFSRVSEPDATFVVSVSTDKQRVGARTPHFFFNDISRLLQNPPKRRPSGLHTGGFCRNF